jgi:phosphoenolpyruvate synthase/pyruvate phosphate dikinase
MYYALVQVFDEYAQQHPQLAGLGEYYEIGAVFNSPRACLRAETIARHVAFAAFSADDLTALTFGCERQDAEKFFPQYIYDKIYLVSAKCTVVLNQGWEASHIDVSSHTVYSLHAAIISVCVCSENSLLRSLTVA